MESSPAGLPSGPQFRCIEKFAWEQHGKEVKVYVTNLSSLKSHSTDKIIVEFTRDTLDIRLLDVQEDNYRFYVKKAVGEDDIRLQTEDELLRGLS
jgi:hypothetical protein